MRVNSHHISRAKKIRVIVLLGVCAIVLLVAVPAIVTSVASLIFVPIHKIETWVAYSTAALPQFLRDRSVLIDELNSIKYSQSAQSGDRFTVLLLTKENQELRSLLGAEDDRRVLAGVIGRPQSVPYDVLVLDKGSSAGITQGAPVFIGNNAIIGVVQKVFSDSSIVILVTTPGFTTSVYILGPDIYTTAEGVGGGQLKIGVPQGIGLQEGNLVILPGVQSGIYGAISHVDSVPTEPQQYGYVSPETPLTSLRLVSVGKSPLPQLSFEEAELIVSEIKNAPFVVSVPENILVTSGASGTSSTSTASSSLPRNTTP